jgi:hypothetical protein
LLEYADRTDKLAAYDNPFAIVVLAHLQALQTRRDPLKWSLGAEAETGGLLKS